jgi:Ras-related protein Rab-1A
MTKKNIDFDYLLKTVIIGDSSVGKSSIMFRHCDDTFNLSYISTIGVDFRYKSINIDNKRIKLQIWDTAGQERFKTITTAYYRQSIIVIFDVTNKQSFINANRWLIECKNICDDKINLLLIGNKCDYEKREVSKEEATKYAEENNLCYAETSAKTGYGIPEAFELITKKTINKINSIKNITDTINATQVKFKTRSYCDIL